VQSLLLPQRGLTRHLHGCSAARLIALLDADGDEALRSVCLDREGRGHREGPRQIPPPVSSPRADHKGEIPRIEGLTWCRHPEKEEEVADPPVLL
jgi:hypothetical protein